MSEFHKRRDALYREFPAESAMYESEYNALAAQLAEAKAEDARLTAEVFRMGIELGEAELERDALVNTLETIAHDAREYHGELWSAEFAKSALSALERHP